MLRPPGRARFSGTSKRPHRAAIPPVIVHCWSGSSGAVVAPAGTTTARAAATVATRRTIRPGASVAWPVGASVISRRLRAKSRRPGCRPVRPGRRPAAWEGDRLDVDSAAGEEPGDHGVRVPHLAETELVATPDGQRDARHQGEQPLGRAP